MSGPHRSTALTWAAIAEVVLCGLLFALIVAFDGDDGVPFGVPGASAVLLAAIVTTAAGAVVAGRGAGVSAGPRIAVTALVAVAAGLVAVLAITCFFSPNGSVAGLGIPLVLAVVGMNVVAARVAANTRHIGQGV